MSCAKVVEPVKMPFWLWTRVGPVKHALYRGAYWRQTANATEPSMCGDATFLLKFIVKIYLFKHLRA